MKLFADAGPDSLERHALDELVLHARLATGAEPATAAGALPEGADLLSVGRTGAAEALLASGALRLPSHREGFVVRSLARAGGGRTLALLGGSPAGTLAAVHHYLERVCGFGFFWDGTQVPRMEALPLDGIDVASAPRFATREYMMDCEYSSWWWDWPEWKAEVDWASRHGFNLLSSNFDFTATWRAVWRRFGVEVPASSLSGPPFHPWAGWHKWDISPPYPEPFQEAIAALCKRFVDYGRSLGMRVTPDFRGFLGQVPREFHDAWRDRARFVEVRWLDFDPPGVFIHPDDPLYLEVYRAYLQELEARFGTDHLYAAQGFSEMVPGDTPEEQRAIVLSGGRRALEAVRAVDPAGVLYGISWTWLNDALWPPEQVAKYLDQFPDDALQVWELWEDQKASFGAEPTHRRFDWFSGKCWLLGFLHSYGGTTMPHGDLAGLIGRLQAVAADPRASRCEGIALQPEALRHDAIWFDLLARLAWDPAGVTLEGFLHDYARRRYGPERGAAMVPALEDLAATVYGTDDAWTPRYQRRILERLVHREKPLASIAAPERLELSVPERSRFLPRLRRAAESMLAQEAWLGASALYADDLTDVCRSTLGILFDLRLQDLYEAFGSRDAAVVRAKAEELRAILASQERLLGSNPSFRLGPLLDRARALPGAPPGIVRAVRDILTVWAGRILDYARRDYHELLRFYYRPRVEAFLAHVGASAADGSWRIDDAVLVAAYESIERSFVEEGFALGAADYPSISPVQACREALSRHPFSEEDLHAHG